jgi:hypothetical protein
VWDVLYRVFRLLSDIIWLVSGGGWVVRAVRQGWVSRASGCCGWSRRGSAVGGVEHFRHLVVVDAVGVVSKGCMGVLVFEGFGFVLVASAVLLVRGGRSGECGVIDVEVPGRRGKLVPRR